MYRINSIAFLIMSLLIANSVGAEESPAKPNAPAEEPEAIPDPSLTPAPTGDGLSGERIRLIADFDGDGREDLALSGDTKEFGNAGSMFELYISDGSGKYIPTSSWFFAHPMAIAIEKCGEETRIWTYLRINAREGALGFQELKGLTLLDFVSIHILTGPECSVMGNAMYQAVFTNSDCPIRAEASTTVDGVVQWRSYYTNRHKEKSEEADESGPNK